MTLVLTAFQLYIDYEREVSEIEQRFVDIQHSYLDSLTNSLWNLDKTLLMTQLEGIVKLPDMLKATVTEAAAGDYTQQQFSAGIIDRGNGVTRNFALIYSDHEGERQIGNLVVHGTYSGVYQRLLEKVTVILVSQGIKTFIVSFFILFIIHRLVTRHLTKISDSLSQMDSNAQGSPLVLERKPPPQDDELSQMVQSFNYMRRRLKKALDQLHHSNQRLEKRVAEKTRSLRQQIIERDAAKHQLMQSEQRFRDIAETASDWFWEMDDQLAFSFMSRRFSEITGLSEQRLIGYTRQQLIDQGLLEMGETQAHQLWKKMDQHEPFQSLEARLKGEEGQTHHILIGGKPMFDRHKQFLGYRGAGRDITLRKVAEEAIRRSNDELEKRIETRTQELRKLSQAVEQSPVSIIITNLDGHIEYVNPSFSDKTGYPSIEVQGKKLNFLRTDDTHESVYRELWQTIKQGQDWSGEFHNRNRDGSVFWVQTHISPVKDSRGKTTHYLVIEEDVTLRKAQEQRILHQAQYDSLTDLPNRMLAVDRLNQGIKMAKRNRRRVAVMFVDLDDFKKVNDTLGHDVGDQLLIEASRRLQSTVRDGDTVARQGGDEFLIILSGIDSAADVEPVAQEIISSFMDPFSINDVDFVVTPSIGLSLYPDDGEEANVLMKNADSAMYRAKDQGGSSYHFFTSAMNQEVQRKLEIERYLHHALDCNELELVYQPIFEAESRQISGIEVLLRWHSKALGSVGPAEFIPVAEQTGIIIAIGAWVIKTACSQVSEWNQRFKTPLKLSVNVSPRQFRDRGFVELVKHNLCRDIDPTMFEIEITEGLFIDNRSETLELLSELKAHGIQLSMDDFGTGYSSLSYLQNLPFDRLKIDQSFVQSITDTTGDLALVTAVITMAHSLGLEVVGEGVETEEQFQILCDLGCDFVQGYLFSRPLAAQAFEAYVENLDLQIPNPSTNLPEHQAQ